MDHCNLTFEICTVTQILLLVLLSDIETKLTPLRKVRLQKLIITQLLKNFPSLYET